MKKINERGFTLIELLAVIIILAVIALIATPIVLNVIDDAKVSAHKSSVALFADAIKLEVYEDYFTNQTYPIVNVDWINNNVQSGGGKVTCNEAYYDTTYGVILHECSVSDEVGFNVINDITVNAETLYCYAKETVYTDCTDTNYITFYNEVKSAAPSVTYKDSSGANQPDLLDKMVAVKYDGTNWVVADTTKEWYNYNNKEWANAVVLNNGINKNVNDTLNLETEVAMMYVWIPRYKYTIFNGNGGSVAAQEINVQFESGTANTGTVTCSDNIGTQSISEDCGTVTNGTSTYTHPAFTLGTQELTGIWVGKFENSTSNATCNATPSVANCNVVSTITIKPNVVSWRIVQVGKFYNSIKNAAATYSLTNADTHMMKNMEWGAVAYLTQSKYGRCVSGICDEVSKNDSSSYLTGKSQGIATPTTNNTVNGTYSYNTQNGQLASTTGNIYGVYDMSGGAWEYVMGNAATSSTSPIVGYNTSNTSNFSGKYYNGATAYGSYTLDTKYTNLYSYDASSYKTYRRGKLGDATKETLQNYFDTNGGWNNDGAFFPYSNNPFFGRGGGYADAHTAGVFNFVYRIGNVDGDYGSRTVVSKKN